MKKAVVVLIICALSALQACVRHEPEDPEATSKDFSRVMILYSVGYNDLSSYLNEDINDIVNGEFIPEKKSKKALVVVSHLVASGDSYKWAVPTSPIIFRIYKEGTKVVRDTLCTLASGENLSTAKNMLESLSFIKDVFEAESYGMVLSSHGTGWIPKGYYESANDNAISFWSFGAERRAGTSTNDEMSLAEIAESIPMHMDYMLFDACLMGGIETAFELRNVADMVAFSPAEVLTDGFEYSKLARHLLKEYPANPQAVCEDYYNLYMGKTGASQSATISLVDNRRIWPLAGLCRTLFERYRTQMSTINAGNVQRYFTPGSRSNHSWYYDLEDIIINCGASEADLASLSAALDNFVVYKAATPGFLVGYNGFEINHFCGLSMYLPAKGNSELDEFYRTISWNKATHLVD